MNMFHPDPELYAAAHAGTVYYQHRRSVVRGDGADRLDLLHRLSTNATRELPPFGETTTILTSDKGRVVEVVRVLAFDDHVLLLLAGTDAEGVRAWLDKYTIMDDFSTSDRTADFALVGVYGDHAKSLIERAFGVAAPDAGTFASFDIGGDGYLLRDTRLTGAGGFLLVLPAAALAEATARLDGAGARAIDEATYQALRVEAGLPAIGHELTEAYNPLEAGLSQFISWTKGCYIGQEVIARLDTYDKVQRHMVGMELLGQSVPEGELEVRDDEGKKIGAVTTLAYSPARGRAIALGYVRTVHAVPGNAVGLVAIAEDAAATDERTTARLVKLPFDR